MQQHSATLIYDLNTIKGRVESYLKKNSTAIQIAPSSLSLKKTPENCFEPPQKNPFNMATLFIWPHFRGPLVTGLTRFHCIYYIGIDMCFAGKYMYKACKFHTKLPPGRPK